MRRLLSTLSAGTVLLLGTGVLLGTSAPALAAGDNIALVVEPQLVQTGGVVKLTANNCKNTTASAVFSPTNLGSVTLAQSIGNNSVWGNVTIPAGTPTGVYTITANCVGSDVKASQSLYVYQAQPTPTRAPNTGGVALGGSSGAAMTAAGVGLAGLGGLVGVLAWRRRRASLVD
ncbi:hypothetical protein [Longispora albida]|uniref:hypothetical protein n=1 Tax=Longispora albida TaxID=203523 RepID=UPI00036BE2C9|nr:hypothetical protein [Longispora albida]